MIAFCRVHGIQHEICGKVVVATQERELTGLEELQRRENANGVVGLAMIGPERLRDLEPDAAGIRTLQTRCWRYVAKVIARPTSTSANRPRP